jgi:hypothetical protein
MLLITCLSKSGLAKSMSYATISDPCKAITAAKHCMACTCHVLRDKAHCSSVGVTHAAGCDVCRVVETFQLVYNTYGAASIWLMYA